MADLTVAFSGTRKGLTMGQTISIRHALESAKKDFITLVVRHGMCKGADEEFHELAVDLGAKIIGHPGVDKNGKPFMRSSRAGYEHIYSEEPFLIRNRMMVDIADFVIAAPAEMTEQQRSGTWATIRYARRLYRFLYIVWPNGLISVGRGVQVLQAPM